MSSVTSLAVLTVARGGRLTVQRGGRPMDKVMRALACARKLHHHHNCRRDYCLKWYGYNGRGEREEIKYARVVVVVLLPPQQANNAAEGRARGVWEELPAESVYGR